MFVKLTERELEMMEEISNITGTDYELKGDFIPVSSLIEVARDLLNEVHIQQEIREDLEEDMRENYVQKKFDPYLEYGLNENDFH